MEDRPKTISHLSWSRPRFSVRGLILFVLVVGIMLGWAIRFVRSVHLQRKAAMAIFQAGGSTWYAWEWGVDSPAPTPTNSFWEGNHGCVPSGWERWIEVDFVRSINFVFLLHAGTDREMAHIGHLTQLEVLYLNATRVTDAGLTDLEGLTALRYLSLGGSKITDAGLVHLKGLTNLRVLNLINTKVSDAGIRDLQRALPLVKIEH